MKLIIVVIFAIGSLGAHAYTSGSYTCSSDASWKRYEVTIKEIKLDPETTLPFVTYKKGSLQASGIATVVVDEDSETLSLGTIDLISFVDGKAIGSCEVL